MNRVLIIILSCFFMLAARSVNGQGAVSYKIAGEFIYATVHLQKAGASIDSIIQSFGFENVDGISEQTSNTGWEFVDQTNDAITFKLNKNKKTKKLPSSFVVTDAEVVHVQPPPFANYGVNNFKEPTVFSRDGKTTFTLNGYGKASNVYLSGSFNDWSTLKTPMKKTDAGWEVTLDLNPGKYLYKFIVDGHWMEDKNNRLKEDDWNGGYNSVYFVYNKLFRLPNYSSAKKVSVAGSFNNWQPLKMYYSKKYDVWALAMYLREGTHAYKFVVDGDWIVDPTNDVVRDDGEGNKNSFTSIGDTFYFKLNGYHNANEVYVAGEFNGWNFGELKMQRSFKGWELPYVLAPGNYAYKFRIDGAYEVDPDNPINQGSEDYKNSILVVGGNHEFILKGHSDANIVRLAGSFNGWDPEGYTMQRKDGAWRITIHLPKGKHTYRFIVDGEWITDPENDLWERNEFNSRNSVLWVDEYSN